MWALLALWVLALFSLHRDALRYLPRPDPGGEFVSTTEDPYPGLLNLPFLFAVLRVTATTLALGGVIFLAMPRRSSMARLQTGALPARHLTGFDDEVKLGQLGEILENDSVVMSIELYDYDWKRIAAAAGATLAGRDDDQLRQGPLASAAADGPCELPRSAAGFEGDIASSSGSISGSNRPTRPSSSA